MSASPSGDITDVVRVRRPGGHGPLVLTCEHASATVPPRYDSLGLPPEELLDHIGWDIGAAAVARMLCDEFDSPCVESGYSRLVIDCNRDLGDHDLIVAESHGVGVPGNRAMDPAERAFRIATFYDPYHRAVDEVIAARRSAPLLLSLHSFTPVLGDRARDFDVGVLYDDHEAHAERLALALAGQGFSVRHNEPYSGFDGLIFSARSHGRRHRISYLELEVNNGLIRSADAVFAVAQRVAIALRSIL